MLIVQLIKPDYNFKAAEVAFVSACNMRFFNDKLGYSPVLKQHRRVIDEQLYFRLGI